MTKEQIGLYIYELESFCGQPSQAAKVKEIIMRFDEEQTTAEAERIDTNNILSCLAGPDYETVIRAKDIFISRLKNLQSKNERIMD